MFPPKRKLWRGLGSQLDLSSAADRLLSGGECVGGSREWPGVNADTSPRFGARLGDRCASPGPMRGVMAGEGRGGAALSVLSTPSLSKRPLRRGVYAGGEPLRNAPSFFTRSPSITSHPEPPSILFAPPPSPPGTPEFKFSRLPEVYKKTFYYTTLWKPCAARRWHGRKWKDPAAAPGVPRSMGRARRVHRGARANVRPCVPRARRHTFIPSPSLPRAPQPR